MPPLDDPQGFAKQLERELEKIDQFRPEDRDAVKRWMQRRDGSVETSTIATYLRNLRACATRLDKPLRSLTEERFDAACYDFVHEAGLASDTVRNYQFVVRDFLQFTHGDGHWSADYPIRAPAKPTVDPEDMLTPEDIGKLRDAAKYHRDIAVIEFLADTGARLTLALSLRVCDVDLDSDRATYRPNPNAQGLKGANVRRYPLIDSRATIRTYLDHSHPRSDRDDVALFHKIRQYEDDRGGLDPNAMRSRLHDIADRAGVEKPVNPHNFRHSAITRMRREGYDRAEIEHRVHWTIDTDMWERYEHISGEQHNQAIFEKSGLADSGDAKTPASARTRCGACHEPVAPHHHRCPRCGNPVSRAAMDSTSNAIAEGADLVSTLDGRQQLTVSELVTALAGSDIVVVPDDHDESSDSKS